MSAEFPVPVSPKGCTCLLQFGQCPVHNPAYEESRASLLSPPETPHQQGIRGSPSLDVETALNESYEPPAVPPPEMVEALDALEEGAFDRGERQHGPPMTEATERTKAARSKLEQLFREQREERDMALRQLDDWETVAGNWEREAERLDDALASLKKEQLTPDEARRLRAFTITGKGGIEDEILEKLWNRSISGHTSTRGKE